MRGGAPKRGRYISRKERRKEARKGGLLKKRRVHKQAAVEPSSHSHRSQHKQDSTKGRRRVQDQRRHPHSSDISGNSRNSRFMDLVQGKDPASMGDIFPSLDEEMEYLEEKLKIKGGSMSKSLQDELDLDGLGDLHSFLEHMEGGTLTEDALQDGEEAPEEEETLVASEADQDDVSDREEDLFATTPLPENEQPHQIDDESDVQDDAESESDVHDAESESDVQDDAESESDVQDDAESESDVHDDAESESESEDDEGGKASATGGAYVPPHLRNLGGAKTGQQSQAHQRLVRQCKGLMNRLSEKNIETLCAEFKTLYEEHSTRELTEILARSVLDAVCDEASLLSSLVVPSAALIASLHIQVGMELGAVFLEHCVERFEGCYAAGDRKPCSNLVLFLGHLYSFEVIHCNFIYGLVRKLAATFQPLDMELLLTLLQYCGYQLRKDDPRALKDIVQLLQQQATKAGYSRDDSSRNQEVAAASQDTGMSGAKIAYMLDVLYDLKTNRQRMQLQQQAQVLTPLKNWLKNVNAGHHHTSSSQQLRCSYQDVVDCKTRGRWWLVGSAWTGAGEATSSTCAATTTKDAAAPSSGTTSSKSSSDNEAARLMRLAAEHRMNTDIRRSVFCIIMGAQDYMDAFEKLSKLNLKGTSDRDVARVIMHCCAGEKVYNPYYEYLALQLCEFHRKYRFTFQLAFWDVLKEHLLVSSSSSSSSSSYSKSATSNLAQCLAGLVSSSCLSLAMLKVIDFADLNRRGRLFLLRLVHTLLVRNDRERVNAIFGRVSQSAELQSMRESLLDFMDSIVVPYVLKKQVEEQQQQRSTDVPQDKARRTLDMQHKEMRAKIKAARRVLKAYNI